MEQKTPKKINPKKTPIPEQDPAVRRSNFEEVALGYSPEQAVGEALRCLQCKNQPCVSGCPVGVPIPRFIKAISENNFPQAIAILKEANLLPAVCGRVCPRRASAKSSAPWQRSSSQSASAGLSVCSGLRAKKR